MPQGTRKCGCPARWCSCGGTVNKSELRTKTKVPAVRKAAIVAPPTGKATQGDTEANIQEGAAKVAVVVEDSKKNVLAEKPSAKLHEKTEAAWPNTEGDAKLVKKPVLKRGRSSAKSLGLDKIAVKALSEAKPDSEELKGNPAKQPANKVHKSHKKKVLASAPVAPRPILRDRAHEDKESEKGQDGERNVQKDAGSTEVVLGVSAGRLRSRIKNQITRIRREEALLEAYSGSHEKLRPEEELLRARSQIHRSKLAIRGAVQELESLMNHGTVEKAQERRMGRRKHDHVNCAVCQTGHVTSSNDILLCDGGCKRAFHQYCLEPAITPDRMPADEESWLCPACDIKLDCIYAINKQFGTKLLMTSPWQDVFSEEAEQEVAGTSPKVPQGSEWPSDDSADEDYDPDKEDSAAKGEDSEGEKTVPGAEDPASRDSDASDDDMDDDISEEEAKALLEEGGPDAAGAEPAEPEERPEDFIIEGKRRRTPVDYRILNFALFGFDDVTDDSDEDAEGAAKKRRTKNALEEPIFTTDVTGAPRPKPDVGTPQQDGAHPQIKQEADIETEVGAVGGTETAPEQKEGEGAKPEDTKAVKAEVEGAVEVKVEAVDSGGEEKPNGVLESARIEQARASKYRPELEDVAYNVLKTSFLENQLPSLEKKQELCEQLKLPIDQVNRWFRGYRHKVLTALNRPPDPESQAPGSKYPPWSSNEVASEEAVERDRRVNLVLKSTGKLRAALAKAAELRQVARENGEESSEADSPRCPEGRGILARLKRKAEGPEGFAAKKGKRTAFGNAGGGDKGDEARVLQSTLQRLAALDTRPLSVNGNRMGRPPIRMIELMAEVETLHGGQLPELLAKHAGLKPLKPAARPPTLLQQSLMRGRREPGADGVGEDAQGLEGSDGSGSWGTGRRKVREESGGAGEGAEDGQPRMGPPAKLVKEEPRLQRAGSFNSNQSFDEDESGLEDSWVAALDKRPFSKNGKRMGRPSRQVKEAILQFRREKHAAAGLPDDSGLDVSAGTESTEEQARAPGEAPPAKNGAVPRFSKSGKRIGRPPRALRKPEGKPAALPEAVPQAESLHRSDSFGSLDGSTIGPDGVRYSKSGRRIGKPQRLGVVDPDELMQKQEEGPPFPAAPGRRMTSILGSFDDLTAAIDHLEKPAAKVPRRERSADRLLDERTILSGIRKRVASSNKLSAFVTSSGNDVNEQDSGGAAGAAGGSGEEAQSARTGVNGSYDGANRPAELLESLFTAVTAHEELDGEMAEKVDGTETGEESLAVEQLLIAVANPVTTLGFANLSSTEDGLIPGLFVKSAADPPPPVNGPPGGSSAPNEVTEKGQESAPVEDAGPGSSGEQLGASEAPSDIPLGNTFSSSGDLAAMAASLMSPVRRPDRPPRKGGKRAFSSIARVGSVPGIANLVTQSISGAPSEGTSV